MSKQHDESSESLESLEHDRLAVVHGGERKQPAERRAADEVRANNADALKRYNRPPETAAGQAVVDGLAQVPGVRDPKAAHRIIRGVTEGTIFRGAGRPAY